MSNECGPIVTDLSQSYRDKQRWRNANVGFMQQAPSYLDPVLATEGTLHGGGGIYWFWSAVLTHSDTL